MEVDKNTQQMIQVAEKFNSIAVINNATDYEQAASMLKTIKAHVKTLEDKRKELVEPYIKGKAALDDFFKKPQEKCKLIIDKINSAMNEYVRKENERVKAEQAKIEAEHQKEADRLAKLADKAEAKGDDWKAEELKEKALEVQAKPMPIAQRDVPPVPTARRENWKFEVIDESKLPREFMQPDMVKIGKYVREQKANSKIDGVKITVDYTNY